ncbi:uncharacterized protein ACMZJ9_015005 [Mantella aurantiaca]
MKITDYFPPVSCEDREDNSVVSGSQGQEMPGNTRTLTMQTPKKRKEKFSDPEVKVLLKTILEHIEQLFGSKPADKAEKDAIWGKVVKKVNKKSKTKRTLKECKKRWSDFKVNLKKKIKEALSKEVPWREGLSEEEIAVAEFFKLHTEDPESTQLRNGSLLDNDDNSDSEVSPSVESNIKWLIAEQKKTNERFKAMKNKVNENLKLQNEINQKQKAYILTMTSLCKKMGEITDPLEETESSDDSDSDTVTPKMAKTTPAKKRKVTETPSSFGSLKKKEKKKD